MKLGYMDMMMKASIIIVEVIKIFDTHKSNAGKIKCENHVNHIF